MAQISIAKNQQVTLIASMKDAANAEVAGEDLDLANLPRWSEDSKETVVRLEKGDDVKSVVVVGVSVGTANVTCLDPGSSNSDVIQVVVLADGVKKVTIAPGLVQKSSAPAAPAPSSVKPESPPDGSTAPVIP